MKDSEKLALVRKSLRNSRRQYRAADTAGEKLERRLDRLILRKTAPSGAEWTPLINEYSAYKSLVQALERSLADSIAAGNV